MAQQAFAQVNKQAQVQKPQSSLSLQRECDNCRKKKRNLKADSEKMPSIMDGALHSPATPPGSPRQSLAGQRFGYDFSRVPVHSRSPASIQTKLAVNAPGDIYEQEADRIADQVMAAPRHPVVGATPLQIQRLSASSGGQMEAPASVERALASPGRPLEPALRQEMEWRFGHDFSQVRVYTDSDAADSANEVHAQAFTVGSNVVFANNQFSPVITEDKRLLAHELTHVVQQSKGALAIQRQPPATTSGTPREKAIEFLRRAQVKYPNKLDQSAATLDGLEDIFRRTMSGKRIRTPRPGEYLPTATRGAAGELNAISRALNEPTVNQIRVVPPQSGTGAQRTPDLQIDVQLPDGSIVTQTGRQGTEIRTLTGAGIGYTQTGSRRNIDPISGLPIPTTIGEIVNAIRSKIFPSGQQSQIAAGGNLTLSIRRGGPNVEANIASAVDRLNPRLIGTGAQFLRELIFNLPGNIQVRYVRDAGAPNGRFVVATTPSSGQGAPSGSGVAPSGSTTQPTSGKTTTTATTPSGSSGVSTGAATTTSATTMTPSPAQTPPAPQTSKPILTSPPAQTPTPKTPTPAQTPTTSASQIRAETGAPLKPVVESTPGFRPGRGAGFGGAFSWLQAKQVGNLQRDEITKYEKRLAELQPKIDAWHDRGYSVELILIVEKPKKPDVLVGFYRESSQIVCFHELFINYVESVKPKKSPSPRGISSHSTMSARPEGPEWLSSTRFKPTISQGGSRYITDERLIRYEPTRCPNHQCEYLKETRQPQALYSQIQEPIARAEKRGSQSYEELLTSGAEQEKAERSEFLSMVAGRYEPILNEWYYGDLSSIVPIMSTRSLEIELTREGNLIPKMWTTAQAYSFEPGEFSERFKHGRHKSFLINGLFSSGAGSPPAAEWISSKFHAEENPPNIFLLEWVGGLDHKRNPIWEAVFTWRKI